MSVLTGVGIYKWQANISHAVTGQVCPVSHGVFKVLSPTRLHTLGAAEHPVLIILNLKISSLTIPHLGVSPHLHLLTGEVMGRALSAGGEASHVRVEAAAPQPSGEVVIIQGAAIPRAPHGHTGLVSRVIVPGLDSECK